MKYQIPIISLIFFSLFHINNGIGQIEPKATIEYSNSCGKKLFVYETLYLKDSTKQNSGFTLFETSKLTSYINFDFIRIDCFAIDVETKDTIFSKSLYNSSVVPVSCGLLNAEPEIISLPKLMIQSSNYYDIISVSDYLEIKLTDKRKISGTVNHYNNKELTITDSKNNTIHFKNIEILAIRNCGSILGVGALSFGKKCKYSKLKNASFSYAVQTFNTKTNRWEWVKKK